MSKLTPTDVKNVYLLCDMKNPEGMYANEVDLLEFADKLERVILHRIAQAPSATEKTCCWCAHAEVSAKVEPCKTCYQFDKWEPAP